jgi:hypothetical protein
MVRLHHPWSMLAGEGDGPIVRIKFTIVGQCDGVVRLHHPWSMIAGEGDGPDGAIEPVRLIRPMSGKGW